MSKLGQKECYSREELEAMIAKMQAVTGSFYGQAVATGNHAFLEFCGLMGEYVKMCRTTLHASKDFSQANVHSGVPLVAEDYQIQYLAEKFECIFGPVLQNPKNRAIFFKGMGWEETIIEGKADAEVADGSEVS